MTWNSFDQLAEIEKNESQQRSGIHPAFWDYQPKKRSIYYWAKRARDYADNHTQHMIWVKEHIQDCKEIGHCPTCSLYGHLRRKRA